MSILLGQSEVAMARPVGTSELRSLNGDINGNNGTTSAGAGAKSKAVATPNYSLGMMKFAQDA